MSNEVEFENKSLQQLFKVISESYYKISDSHLSSNDREFQDQIKMVIDDCNKAFNLVSRLALFSENEKFDEISTESIKFITIPAYLGYFHSRIMDDRLGALSCSIDFFEDFKHLCVTYSIPNIPFGDSSNDQFSASIATGIPENMRIQATNREARLRWFKERKEISERLKIQAEYIEKEHVDDEIKRKYYIDSVRFWAIEASELLPNIRMEYDFISRRGEHEKNLQELKLAQEREHKKNPNRKPFILTKEMIKANVFGPGYPSQPTMSLEEFRSLQISNQSFPEASGKGEEIAEQMKGDVRRVDPSSRLAEADEQDEIEEDEQEDRDDPNLRAKRIGMDEFKDENRAGSGNTYRRL